MIHRIRQRFIKAIYISIDFICMMSAIYIASQLRVNTLPFDVSFWNLFFLTDNPYRFVFYFWILISIILNQSNGLYQTKREIYETFEVWQVVKSSVFAALITIVAIYLLRIEAFPRSIMLVATALALIFLTVWRLAKRMLVEYLVSQGYNNFNVLIIGAGRVGNALVHEIEKRRGLGLQVVGFLDDYKTNDGKREGPKILGKISSFESIARKEFVHEVYITVHHDSKVFLEILEIAKELGIAIRVIPQGFESMVGEFRKYNIGHIPVLDYYTFQESARLLGKRIFDFLVSLIVLLSIWPLLLLIAILIKLDSRGSVFYFSRRYGCRGRIFSMFKFRSMISDADKKLHELRHKNEVDGPIFKIKNDPRVTAFGRFLRKYSLDELPQFINVFTGDMSLVGPRPLPIDQVEKEDVRQLRRLEIRPGITGLWQISGRSDTSFAHLLRWDTWYVKHWSFWLDLKILFKTLPVVCKGRGAY